MKKLAFAKPSRSFRGEICTYLCKLEHARSFLQASRWQAFEQGFGVTYCVGNLCLQTIYLRCFARVDGCDSLENLHRNMCGFEAGACLMSSLNTTSIPLSQSLKPVHVCLPPLLSIRQLADIGMLLPDQESIRTTASEIQNNDHDQWSSSSSS